MSAVMSENAPPKSAGDAGSDAGPDTELQRLMQRVHGVERSWLEHTLNAWGDWIQANWDYEGYPRSDAVAAWLDGGGGFGVGARGHKVLCLDMPHRIYSIHARWLLLCEGEREVVWAHYVPVAKDNGQVWEPKAKAAVLGLCFDTYRKRLWRAKIRMLGLVPG